MDVIPISDIVADLRAEGGDVAEVEVKHAAKGFPESVAATLAAFANMPGGGLLILGLDEASGFTATGVHDVSACKAALASMARQALDPPVTFTVQTVQFEGASLVVAEIHELPSVAKPCRVRATGRAYLRAHDGDYRLSQVEEQAFLAHRGTPRFDQAVIPEATGSDLDPDLVHAYIESCRGSSASLRRLSDEDILFRTGVTAGPQRLPTVAGLLALGVHPQQFLPNAVIQASVAPGPGDPPGTRAQDTQRFDGPIPLVLDEALRWVQRNTRTRIRFGVDGHGHDEPEYPAEAVRELLSNALVHRDLGPHALGQAITLKLDQRQLLLSNPGGLWGLTVDQLGVTGVTSTRNTWLARICQNVRSGRDRRVIEALASGIPTILRSLHEAGMVPPRFHDQGIRFTVQMSNHALLAPEDLSWLARTSRSIKLTDAQRHALVAMRHGAVWTNKTLREAFPMDSREATAALVGLVRAGLAEPLGDGGARTYRLRASAAVEEHVPDAAGETSRRYGSRRANARKLLDRLNTHGPASLTALAAETDLTRRQTHYALVLLREENQVQLIGGQGTDAVYRSTG
ncbi:ATP-binding protein [Nonomuraea sp. NPDC049714]|uniref:ATP-binding protein n=1 Tax=Nonomuraea sp. NPDC049714 TaxID=3364357 RepID=UPI0037A23253